MDWKENCQQFKIFCKILKSGEFKEEFLRAGKIKAQTFDEQVPNTVRGCS